MNQDNSNEWLGAEAERDDKPLMVRARKFSRKPASNSRLPFLLVVDFTYEADDNVGLPNDIQYNILDEFEKNALDEMEKAGSLELVFIETCNGLVRYYSYVADVSAIVNQIDDIISGSSDFNFSSNFDPDWLEYGKKISLVS